MPQSACFEGVIAVDVLYPWTCYVRYGPLSVDALDERFIFSTGSQCNRRPLSTPNRCCSLFYLHRSLQTADLREDLALATGRAKEAEALWERGRADLERLEEGHRRAQSALDARNQEV